MSEFIYFLSLVSTFRQNFSVNLENVLFLLNLTTGEAFSWQKPCYLQPLKCTNWWEISKHAKCEVLWHSIFFPSGTLEKIDKKASWGNKRPNDTKWSNYLIWCDWFWFRKTALFYLLLKHVSMKMLVGKTSSLKPAKIYTT